MPAAAATIDFEPETVDQRIDFEPDSSLGGSAATIEAPTPREPQSDNSGLLHRAINDVREFGTSAGKFIFHGLEGLSLEQAKMLANPSPELYATSAEETLLPQGQQRALEEQRKTAMREQVQPALDSAAHWAQRAAQLDSESNVDPNLAATWDARLSRAAGSATVMGGEAIVPYAGLPIMALNGAAAAEAEAKNSGKTNEQAENAAVRSLIGLALFGGANKVAALGVAKLLPSGSKTLTRFVAQFAGQDTANELSSRAIGAWDAASDAKPGEKLSEALKALTDTTLENSTLNAVYAGIGAAHEAGGIRRIRPDTVIDFVPGRPAREVRPSDIETPFTRDVPPESFVPETARVDPEAVAAANEEGLRAISSQAQEQPTAVEAPVETQTDVSGFPVHPIATEQIAARPDLMQFKQIDNRSTGENANDQITAPYDPIKDLAICYSGNQPTLTNMDSNHTNVILLPTGTTAMQQPKNKALPLRTLKSSANLPDSVPATRAALPQKQTLRTAKEQSTTRPSSSETKQQHTERMLRWRAQDKSARAAGTLRPSHLRPGLISSPVL